MSEEPKARVEWKSKITGAVGHGDLIPQSHANYAAEIGNKETHDLVEHKVVLEDGIAQEDQKPS